jgi:hypothetical protein
MNNFFALGRGTSRVIRYSICSVIVFTQIGCSFQKNSAQPEPVVASELNPVSWVALGKPGPSHRLLHMFVGNWNTRTTMFGGDVVPQTGVTSPASSSTHMGIAKISWILGDRFLKEEFEGEMSGVSFQGVGMMGYDNGARRFTNLWVDSLSTAMVHAKGRYFAEENRFEFNGTVYDPLISKERNVRTTIEIISPKEYVVSTFEPTPQGTEMKTLEIRYEKVG